MQHYRCVKCYFPRTKTVRDCDTVTFFPTTGPFPQVKLEDHLKQAASDIITILTQPPSTTTPSLQAGYPVRNALLTLATQLKWIEPIPPAIEQIVAPPRVSAYNTPLKPPVAASPRLQFQKSVPASTLQVHSKQLKNVRYLNKVPHSLLKLFVHIVLSMLLSRPSIVCFFPFA